MVNSIQQRTNIETIRSECLSFVPLWSGRWYYVKIGHSITILCSFKSFYSMIRALCKTSSTTFRSCLTHTYPHTHTHFRTSLADHVLFQCSNRYNWTISHLKEMFVHIWSNDAKVSADLPEHRPPSRIQAPIVEPIYSFVFASVAHSKFLIHFF